MRRGEDDWLKKCMKLEVGGSKMTRKTEKDLGGGGEQGY
jgi:hypothetical protein